MPLEFLHIIGTYTFVTLYTILSWTFTFFVNVWLSSSEGNWSPAVYSLFRFSSSESVWFKLPAFTIWTAFISSCRLSFQLSLIYSWLSLILLGTSGGVWRVLPHTFWLAYAYTHIDAVFTFESSERFMQLGFCLQWIKKHICGTRVIARQLISIFKISFKVITCGSCFKFQR